MPPLTEEGQLLKELIKATAVAVGAGPDTVIQTRLSGPINKVTLASEGGNVTVTAISNTDKTVTVTNAGALETVYLLVESFHSYEADIGRTAGAVETDGKLVNCYVVSVAAGNLNVPGGGF